MKLYKTSKGVKLVKESAVYHLDMDWDTLVNRDSLHAFLMEFTSQNSPDQQINDFNTGLNDILLAPIGSQEVWAAGVTYIKSRDARKEESQSSGAADLYQMVYEAERPELFFKATPQRVSGPNEDVYIRKDSEWNVPEPELTLFINSNGIIQGYTIGNDMSSRSIEGENALYLPQAKVYEKCAGLGPCLYIPSEQINKENKISMIIKRNGVVAYNESTPISRMKRSLEELCGFLYRECEFPKGSYLMTGTCLVPPSDFTLNAGDVVEISIDGIGTLINYVNYNPKHLN